MRILAICLNLMFCLTVHGQEANSDSSSAVTLKIDKLLAALSNAHQFNGTVLIQRTGKILLNKGYGWKNYQSKTVNDSNSIFQIGSVTKPITATVVLKLREMGKLRLNDKLSNYLPDLPFARKVSLDNLLNQTSGIAGYDVEESDTIAWSPMDRNTILNLFKNRPLAFEPGQKFQYSNSNYFLLGLIIEKVSGKSYEQTVRNLIFEPFKMTHSGFDFIHLTDSSKATGYSKLNVKQEIPAHLIDSTVSFAAGGMYSTTSDLLKFLLAIKQGKSISPLAGDKTESKLKSDYGYGWFLKTLSGQNYFGHGGGIMGFTSYICEFPQADVSIVLLSNVYDETDPLDLPVNDLASLLFDKSYNVQQVKEAAVLDDTLLKKYSGRYFLTGNSGRSMSISFENSRLTAHVGNNTLKLIFNSPTSFIFENVRNATGQFVTNSDGSLKIIISQKGQYEWVKDARP